MNGGSWRKGNWSGIGEGKGSYSRAGAFFALRLLFGILLESF